MSRGRPVLVRLAVTLGLWVFCLCAHAQEAALATDKRLEQPLTLRYLNRSLEDIAKGLSEALQLPIAASMEIRDRKATIIVRNRKAADVMDGLSHCLMMEWRKEANGYRLILSDTGRRLEKEQLKFESDRNKANLRAWIDRLSRYESLDKDGVDELRNDENRRLRQDSGGLSPSERKALQQKLDDLSSPWIAIASTLNRAPGTIERLLLGNSVLVSTSPSRDVLPLKPGLMYELLANGKKILPTEVTQNISFNVNKGELYVPTIYLFEGMNMLPAPPMKTLIPDVSGGKLGPLEESMAKLVADPGELSKRSLSEPSDLRNPGYRSFLVSAADHLGYVSERSSTDIIADAYRQGVSVPKAFEAATIGDYLSSLHTSKIAKQIQFCPVDYVWSKDQFLLVRHAKFWQLQLKEVPERILLPFEDKIAKQGFSTVDDFSQLAGQISDAQREVFDLQSVGLFRFSKYPIGQSFSSLKFWGTLSRSEKQAAESEAGLSLANLPPNKAKSAQIAIADLVWKSALTSEPLNHYLYKPVDVGAHTLRLLMANNAPYQDTEFAPIEGHTPSAQWTNGPRFQFEFKRYDLTQKLSTLGWLDKAR